MDRLKLLIVITFTTILLGGCMLDYSVRGNSEDIRYAKLTEILVKDQKDIILKLSNSIAVSKQIEANLLSPDQPIWKGERQVNDPLFDGFKYEILLHDITPELTTQKFREPIIFEDSVGPIKSVLGSFPPDDSLAVIYIGIGPESELIKIQDLGKNKVLISIHK